MFYLNYQGKHIYFIHIPKSGGTSIGLALERFAKNYNLTHYWDSQIPSEMKKENVRILPHITAYRLKQVLKDEYLVNAYFFTVVRNPYERLISFWAFTTKDLPAFKKRICEELPMTENEILENYQKAVNDVWAWTQIPAHTHPWALTEEVYNYAGTKDPRKIPQVVWYRHPSTRELMVDNVFQIENISEIVNKLKNKVGIQIEIRKENVGQHQPAKEYYLANPQLGSFVEEYFRKDLD